MVWNVMAIFFTSTKISVFFDQSSFCEWCHMASYIPVNINSGYVLSPDNTKPLSIPVLTWNRGNKLHWNFDKITNTNIWLIFRGPWWRRDMKRAFRMTGHLWGGLTIDWWFPFTKGLFSLMLVWTNCWTNRPERQGRRFDTLWRYMTSLQCKIAVSLQTKLSQERLERKLRESPRNDEKTALLSKCTEMK